MPGGGTQLLQGGMKDQHHSEGKQDKHMGCPFEEDLMQKPGIHLKHELLEGTLSNRNLPMESDLGDSQKEGGKFAVEGNLHRAVDKFHVDKELLHILLQVEDMCLHKEVHMGFQIQLLSATNITEMF
jgi:hypothetical protein